MPRLVHLNGPPGIGKSTLARRYIEDHPLAFCLDIDGFRRLIGRWDEHERESGRLARRMALQLAATHLSGGHDVVLPQYVARPQFVGELVEVAGRAGASFHEVVLLAAAADAEARFEARAQDPAWRDHHAEAVAAMADIGGFTSMYERLMDALPDIPAAMVLRTTTNDVDAAYDALLRLLAAGT